MDTKFWETHILADVAIVENLAWILDNVFET